MTDRKTPVSKALDEAISIAKGQTALAVLLNKTAHCRRKKIVLKQQNVRRWLDYGRVPPHWVGPVSEVTGIPRHRLRPDLFEAPE